MLLLDNVTPPLLNVFFGRFLFKAQEKRLFERNVMADSTQPKYTNFL